MTYRTEKPRTPLDDGDNGCRSSSSSSSSRRTGGRRGGVDLFPSPRFLFFFFFFVVVVVGMWQEPQRQQQQCRRRRQWGLLAVVDGFQPQPAAVRMTTTTTLAQLQLSPCGNGGVVADFPGFCSRSIGLGRRQRRPSRLEASTTASSSSSSSDLTTGGNSIVGNSGGPPARAEALTQAVAANATTTLLASDHGTNGAPNCALAVAAVAPPPPSADDDDDDDIQAHVTAADARRQQPSFPVVLWKFSRPHTLIGSALAIPALHLLAAPSLSLSAASCYCSPSRMLHSILYATVPSLLMNVYITGLNQITDVEIDKINKPYLPIAAGMLSPRRAIITVATCLLLSLSFVAPVDGVFGRWAAGLATPGLKFALWGSAVLGTLYSLPPFRLKRFPMLAAFCIVAVRGTVINASFFAHAKSAVFGGGGGGGGGVLQALLTDPKCILSSAFFCVFGIVIALMKDVPDVVGDETSNVRTFPVRLGQRQVFDGARRLLTGLFWAFGIGFAKGTVQAPTATVALCRGITALASAVAGWSVRKESKRVDPENSKQVYAFYMHLWKLFYLSYLVLPFAR